MEEHHWNRVSIEDVRLDAEGRVTEVDGSKTRIVCETCMQDYEQAKGDSTACPGENFALLLYQMDGIGL